MTHLPQLEHYLGSRIASPKSVAAYMFDIRKFTDTNPDYRTYTYDDLSAYFNSLNDRYRREDGRVTGSVARIFVSVKWLYSFLVHTGVRDTHPFPPSYRIKGTKSKGVDGGGILTPDELQGLLAFAKNETVRYESLKQRNLVIISLLVCQGLTGREISNLAVTDIDLDRGMMDIRKTTNTNARRLPLHPTQFMVFNTYMTGGRESLLKDSCSATLNKTFIVNPRGNGDLTDMICRILMKYRLLFGGKPVTAENIRRSVIWNMLNIEKKPVEQVQLFAGHMWPSTTQRYVSAIDFNDRGMINRLHPMELL